MSDNEVFFTAGRRGLDGDGRLLDTKELADTLGCSVSTVKRQVAAGAIPVVRIGRLVRYRHSDVGSLIEALTAPAPLGNTDAEGRAS